MFALVSHFLFGLKNPLGHQVSKLGFPGSRACSVKRSLGGSVGVLFREPPEKSEGGQG